MSQSNLIRSIGCIQLFIIRRLEDKDDNKRENVVRITECDGKKRRENKAESIMYLNQSIS